MAGNKTVQTRASVKEFLAGVDNERRRKDAQAVVSMMRRITGKRATMWGSALIGFGSYHYTYDSGREGDMPEVALSPRKQSLVLYIMPGFSRYPALMQKLGKHKTGKSCLYINKLDDVDAGVLERLIAESVKQIREKYG